MVILRSEVVSLFAAGGSSGVGGQDDFNLIADRTEPILHRLIGREFPGPALSAAVLVADDVGEICFGHLLALLFLTIEQWHDQKRKAIGLIELFSNLLGGGVIP